MIGILCSNENEEIFSEKLHSLFKGINKNGNEDSIIVFTILNIDFLENMVSGTLISLKEIKSSTVPLPSVIFNFSVQLKNSCIKTRKLLEDMEAVELVNNVNRFDQSMIMEILSASETTKKNILPFAIYNNVAEFKIEEDKQYLDIPLKETRISKIYYKNTKDNSNDLIENCCIEKGNIHGLINATVLHKKRILIQVAELVTSDNNPVIIRTYVQRTYAKNWVVLGKDIFPQEYDFNNDIIFEKTNEVALSIISYINNYMPALGICFIDLLLDNQGEIYFLHLGGVGEGFFELKQDEDFYKNFYKNLIRLAKYLNYI